MPTKKKRLKVGNRVSRSTLGVIRNRTKKVAPGPGEVLPMRPEQIVTDALKGNHKARVVRDGEYIHVSDLISKCTRMFALADRYGVNLTGDRIFDSMEIVFAFGHAAQTYLTDKLKRTRPKELYGRWTCPCGESEHTGTYRDVQDRKCACGKFGLEQYNELVIPNKRYKITGSVDVTMYFDHGFYLVEVKSIKQEDFNALVRPLPDHILQAVFYWWLAKEDGYAVYDKLSVVYISKGFSFRNEWMKEFQIDPRDYVSSLDDYLEEAELLKQSKDSKSNPLPHRVCPTMASPQAKKCPTCALCFQVDQ
jgi:hypothetical protein